MILIKNMSILTHSKLGYLNNEVLLKFRIFHHSDVFYHYVKCAMNINTKDDAYLQVFIYIK